jgi:hypothetical protein
MLRPPVAEAPHLVGHNKSVHVGWVLLTTSHPIAGHSESRGHYRRPGHSFPPSMSRGIILGQLAADVHNRTHRVFRGAVVETNAF